jgi:hypothetical protein
MASLENLKGVKCILFLSTNIPPAFPPYVLKKKIVLAFFPQ